MMTIYKNKTIHHSMFKFPKTIVHVYPGYSHHMIKERIWKYKDNTVLHRIYLYNKNGHHKEFICDIIANEPVLVRVGEKNVYICSSNGHIYMEYNIKRRK